MNDDKHDKLLEAVREAIRGRQDRQMSPEAFELFIMSKIKASKANTYVICSRENSGIAVELSIWGDGSVGVNKNRGMTVMLVQEKVDNDFN